MNVVTVCRTQLVIVGGISQLSASSALASFFERRLKATNLLRAEFGEHSLHLSGMLSERGNNETLAAWSEGDDPNAPVFGALNPADQAFRNKPIDSDAD